MAPDDPALPPLDQTAPAYIGTLTHFYRGELGRMMVWRQRFDATSNWAIIATGSLGAFAIGSREMIVESMIIALVVLGYFAFLEARRYRFYDAFRARVRILEVHFIAPALMGPDARRLEGPWRENLVQDLIMPSFKCSFGFALGRRFRHVYGSLHLFVLLGWSALLSFEHHTFENWLNAFRMGRVPGYVILGVILLYFSILAFVIFRSGAFRAKSGEVRRYRPNSDWKSLLTDNY